jgi:transcriptional regulator with PAS, ATPase and Fis domain
MNTTESLKDYQRVRTLAIRSLFEIIEQSSEGTVIVDRDANIVWMNERYARRFGRVGEKAIGKPCESVIPGSLLREVVRTGRPILLDMQDTPKAAGGDAPADPRRRRRGDRRHRLCPVR